MTNQTPELPNRWVRVTHHSAAHIAERYNYAGYGSNLSIEQVSRRCPEADIVGAGHIPGCQLRFAYYATIAEHGEAATPVAVYRFNARDVAAMDRQEGLGRHYERYLVTVTMADGTRQRCFTYVKSDGRLEAPSQAYYSIIERGYADWRFDTDILRAARAYAVRNGRTYGRGYTPPAGPYYGPLNYSTGWEPAGNGTANSYWRMHKGQLRSPKEMARIVRAAAATKKARDGSGKFIRSLVTDRPIRDPSPAQHEEEEGDPRQRYLPVEYLTDPERAARYVHDQTSFTNPRTGEAWTKGKDGVWRRAIDS